MATPPRIFETGSYYHVYNRGNRREQTFLRYRDYERFLGKVAEYKKKYQLEILVYCLMPNHVHFLLQQLADNAISKFMSDLCNSHSRYFNVKYETVGSLFQGRFKAKLVDKDEYLVYLSSYIHLNPLELFHLRNNNGFELLLHYKWSSLPTYLSGKSDEIVNVDSILQYFSSKDPVADYKDFIASNIEARINPVIESLVFEE